MGISKRASRIACALGSSLVFTVGCASSQNTEVPYFAPDLPNEQTAYLNQSSGANIFLIDDAVCKEVPTRISPGRHRIAVAYQVRTGNIIKFSHNNSTFLLDAQPKHSYVAQATEYGKTWTVVLKDLQSGKVVAVPEQ